MSIFLEKEEIKKWARLNAAKMWLYLQGYCPTHLNYRAGDGCIECMLDKRNASNLRKVARLDRINDRIERCKEIIREAQYTGSETFEI